MKILSLLGLGPYMAIGLAIAIAGAVGYNLWENSRIRAETRAVVEAEAMQRTAEAINEVSDAAEKARAMRRYCASLGRVYDFAENKCRGD